MNKQNATKVAKALFHFYPSVNTFHVTNDGQAFELKHNAEAHATHLDKENPLIISVERTEADEFVEEAAPEVITPIELKETAKVLSLEEVKEPAAEAISPVDANEVAADNKAKPKSGR